LGLVKKKISEKIIFCSFELSMNPETIHQCPQNIKQVFSTLIILRNVFVQQISILE